MIWRKFSNNMKLPNPQSIDVFVQNDDLNGLKILHLSDLHINKKVSNIKLAELVKICNELDVDFIVITGDIIDCKSKYIIEKLDILNSIKKKVYYISGNHDLFYGLNDLKKHLTNFILMDNETLKLNINGKDIFLAGISDRFSKYFNIKRDENKISKFLEEHNSTILIAHQPKDYKIALNSNTSLFLCGHTHGGQIFPFHYLVRLVQPFLCGLIYKGKTAIYISKGLGYWGLNFRYKAPNEITILKLISKSVK